MRIDNILLKTSFLEKNLKLFQEIFDGSFFKQQKEGFVFNVGECCLTFKTGADITLAELTLELFEVESLEDFSKRLQFIFYRQFGENYEPSVNLKKRTISFYDFDGRVWNLKISHQEGINKRELQ